MTLSGSMTSVARFDFNKEKGYSPEGSLVEGPDGEFYGVNVKSGQGAKGGTVYKVTAKGAVTVLTEFDRTNPDGFELSAALLPQGNSFYGTTSAGGQFGYGTVFRMNEKRVISVLVHFKGANGKFPMAALVSGPKGWLYGTTSRGGTFNLGTVFRVKADGTFQTLVNFNGNIGSRPEAPLLLAKDGNFYGTTAYGGLNNLGTAFRRAQRRRHRGGLGRQPTQSANGARRIERGHRDLCRDIQDLRHESRWPARRLGRKSRWKVDSAIRPGWREGDLNRLATRARSRGQMEPCGHGVPIPRNNVRCRSA